MRVVSAPRMDEDKEQQSLRQMETKNSEKK